MSFSCPHMEFEALVLGSYVYNHIVKVALVWYLGLWATLYLAGGNFSATLHLHGTTHMTMICMECFQNTLCSYPKYDQFTLF